MSKKIIIEYLMCLYDLEEDEAISMFFSHPENAFEWGWEAYFRYEFDNDFRQEFSPKLHRLLGGLENGKSR